MKHIYTLIAVISVLLFSCSSDNTTTENKTQSAHKAERNRNIEVGNLQVQPLVQTITATGTIDVPPMERKLIHSYIAANITYIDVIQGESVKKGQVLAKLSHPNLIDLQQRLLESKIEMEFQEKELARKQSLVASNATSQKDINAIERALNKEKVSYETLKAQLELIGINANQVEKNDLVREITITAPFDANVSKIFATNGQFINADQPLIELLNEGHKHLELDVFAKDASAVKVGQKIEFNLPGSHEVFTAQVYLINPDLSSNKLRVHGHLDDESLMLKVGTFIESRIIIEDGEVALIENEELIRENNTFYLYQQDGEDFKKVVVSIGRSNDMYTEILDADRSNQWVLKGNYFLQEF